MTKLLLDLGGVVIRTPFEMLDAIGNPPWFGPFNPGADPLWQSMQRQEINERGYWEQRAREFFDGADPMRELFQVLLDQPEEKVVRPEMAAFLAEVDRPGVLTNDMSRFHPPAWVEKMTILSRFDPLIDLSHHPDLKPDPRAFQFAVDVLEIDPDEVLFVDDQPNNLEGAAKVGMRTEWFDVTDIPGSISRIRKAMESA